MDRSYRSKKGIVIVFVILSDRIGVSLIVMLNILHGASMLADRPVLVSVYNTSNFYRVLGNI